MEANRESLEHNFRDLMYRTLCLHGRGSSSQVFQTQLTTLRQRLQNDFELIFVDGEVQSERGYGIPDEFPGPFWSHFKDFTTDSLRTGHELLEAIINEEGPFGGVFAFSEGAALVLSYLLELERNKYDEAAPFDFALLFSPVTALFAEATYVLEEIDSMSSRDFDYLAEVCSATQAGLQKTWSGRDFVDPASLQYQQDLRISCQVLNASNGCALRIATRNNFLDVSKLKHQLAHRDKDCVPRSLHPALLKERIRVTTVFVSRLNDDEDSQLQFLVLPHLFRTGRIVRMVHEYGHTVPQPNEDVQRIVDALSWAIEESKLPIT